MRRADIRIGWRIVGGVVGVGCILAIGAGPATTQTAREAPLPAGASITLHEHDVPLDVVLGKLSRQAASAVRTRHLGNVKVSVDCEKASFWRAVRLIAEQVGAGPAENSPPGSLLLEADDTWAKRPAAFAGPLMILAEQATHTRKGLASGEGISHQVHISLSAWADPNLTVVQYVPELKLLEVRDDRNNTLIGGEPWNPSAAGSDADDDESPAQMQLQSALAWPLMPGKRIAVFRAAVSLSVATRSERWEVEDLSKATNLTRIIDGRRYVIRSVMVNDEDHKVDIWIWRDGADAKTWKQLQQLRLAPTLRMIDAKGKPLYHGGTFGGGYDQKINRSFHFTTNPDGGAAETGRAVKLIWEVPTEIRPMMVEFELKDLPMP